MTTLTHVQLAAMDWPWRGEDPEIAVILTSDEQLLGMATDPDLLIDKIHPHATTPMSLRQLCQQGADLDVSQAACDNF